MTVSRRLLLLALTLCLSAAGCQAYHAQPLDDVAVRRGLAGPDQQQLRTQAGEIRHPILRSIELHPDQGLSPDEAAIIAVLVNPSLRAQRDQRASAQAELLKAGILPNPTLSYNYDFVTG